MEIVSIKNNQAFTDTVTENIILHCIQSGILENKHYKDIYKDCKKRLEIFKDIAYLEVA